MRNLLAVVLTLSLSSGYAIGADCRRHVEAKGDYSICPPEGWETRSKENLYDMFVGPETSGFIPNINVYDETAKMSLKAYVAAGQKQAIKMATDAGATRIEVVGESNVVSDAKERAIRVLYSTEFKGVQIATVQYTYNAMRDRKVIVTCTMPDAEKDKFTPICDRSLKTYKTEKNSGKGA